MGKERRNKNQVRPTMLNSVFQLGDCNSWVERVNVYCKLQEIACSMKFRTLCMIISLSFFLAKAEPHSPITTMLKDLLIAGITFSVVENCTDKEAYDSKYL